MTELYAQENLINIRNEIITEHKVWHSDYSDKGYYKLPTIYLWIYKNTENEITYSLHNKYPNMFHIFDPKEKYQNMAYLKDKIIIKFNQLTMEVPIEPKKEKSWKEWLFSNFFY